MTRGFPVLVLLLAAWASGRTPAQATRPDPSPAPEAWPEHYGNAREDLVPFRRTEPFERFFRSAQPFLGPGRDAPPPPDLKSLRIGLLLSSPLSPDGPRGLMMRRGVELAVLEAEAARPEGALPLELVVREDSPLWGSAANTMAELAGEQGVLAVIGSVESTATHVALRVALKVETFIVNTASSDPTMTETNIPWILRTFPDDRQHGYRLATVIVQERGCRRPVVFRATDRYGRTGVKVVIDSLRRLGAPALLEMRFVPGDPDIETQVTRIRAAEPDAVVFWGDAQDVGRAARALFDAGVRVPFFGPDRLLDPAFLSAAGPAAEGATITYPFDPEVAVGPWAGFRERFLKRFGAVPDHFAGYAYDGARILFDALAKAGPNRFRLRDALTRVRRWEGVTGTLLFDPTLNNLAPLRVARVAGGSFRFEPETPK